MFVVRLTDEERRELKELIGKGQASALKLTRARILLKADQGDKGEAWTDAEIAEALDVAAKTVLNVRRRLVEEGLQAALSRKKQERPSRSRKLDGKAEAKLVATCCGPAPAGRSRWTLRLLADKLVESEVVESVSPETVRGTLKKNAVKPWLKRQWCLPKQHDAEFVWRMEDILEVDHRPYDPRRPVICMDEASKQLVAEVRQPLPLEPGKPLRYDCEYERRGTCNLFLFCEPLRGRVTERRTKIDWAFALRDVLEAQYAEAETVVLVMDNLNTHSPASFYKAFAPQEARRLTERLEIHYTPKHGSWLNIAECEFSVLGRQCLARRIEDGERLAEETAAWESDPNANQINWQFTTEQARIKLHRLYPEFLRQDDHADAPAPSKVYN